MSAIKENLKQLRLARKMTQEEAARQIGVTRQAVSSYESGRTQPDLETLKRFAEIYEVSIRDVLYGGDHLAAQHRRLRWAAGLALGNLILCTLLYGGMLWVSNCFFPVPEGTVAPEMLPTIQQHFAISKAAEAVERFSLAVTGPLFLAAAVLSWLLERPLGIRPRLLYLAVTAAAAILAAAPWALGDPVFGLANYLATPGLQVLEALLLSVPGLIIDPIRLRRTSKKVRC